MVKKTYTASDIEILKGIEPVQKRPGMYTDTSTPNHLLQEVIDNCEMSLLQASVTISISQLIRMALSLLKMMEEGCLLIYTRSIRNLESKSL